MNPFVIVLLVVIGIIVFVVILLFTINAVGYKMFESRFDGDIRYHFIPLNAYPKLIKEDISIKNSYNVNLNGGIFYYPDKKIKAVIIFYHGVMTGWYNYLHVIEYLAKNGYKVVAFDMMGCMSSEGKKAKGVAHGDKDNKRIIDFVTSNKELSKYPLYVCGHSWGGHLTLTSLIHDDKYIKKAVALSPYNSNVDCAYAISPILKLFAPLIYLLNLIKFGHESTYRAVDAIKLTNAKVMILHGGNDYIVNPKYSFKKYKKAVEQNKLTNVTLKFYKDGDHFLYLNDIGAKMFTKELSFPFPNRDNLKNLDYKYVNKLNDSVMKEIVNFFDN